MSRTGRYGAACAGVVGVGALGASLLLDLRGVVGVLAAGAVAAPVQVAAFAVMARARVGTNAFLAAWLGGTVVRVVAVTLGGWALVTLPDLPPLPTLLGLAGFFFVMLVLEPPFLGLGPGRKMDHRRTE